MQGSGPDDCVLRAKAAKKAPPTSQQVSGEYQIEVTYQLSLCCVNTLAFNIYKRGQQ